MNIQRIIVNTAECFDEYKWINVKQNLDTLSDLLREADNRDVLTDNDFNILTQIITKLNEQQENKETVVITTKIFRVLRNACVQCTKNQNYLVNYDDFLLNVQKTLHKLIDSFREENAIEKGNLLLCMKCALQVFGNIVAGSDCDYQRKNKIWKTLGYSMIRELLNVADSGVFSLTSMVIYNCLNDTLMTQECIENDLHQILNSLLNNIGEEGSASEWSLLTVETFLRQENVLSPIYYKLQVKSRLILLDVIHEEVTKMNSSQSEKMLISHSHFESMLTLLTFNMKSIFTLTSHDESTSYSTDNYSPLEVTKLLSIICETTSNQRLVEIYRHKTFIETIIETLKKLHLLANNSSFSSSSHFNSIPPLRKNESIDDQQIQLSPLFGFKRDLVRLIANLSFQCSRVQNWVREMEGITLILDLSRLDARNPYITQWCVFAIRNLLENNSENQSIIASLEKNGSLSDSSLLTELGFEIIDGKIGSQQKK